jgi:hypothetical protein
LSLQTKTTTSGMVKRPNKRPTAVCVAHSWIRIGSH